MFRFLAKYNIIIDAFFFLCCRRSVIIEGIVSEFQRGMKSSNIYTDIDSDEGTKIFKILETSAEPEVLMAEMSPQQLASFASYQSELEVGSADVLETLVYM